MSADYWLGLATLPILFAVLVAAVRAHWWITQTLEARYGLTFQAKAARKVDEIDDYTLRNNIWWERSFGPVFVGGWCREDYQAGGDVVTRWVGFGSTHGPCLIVLRKRVLDADGRR